MHSPARCDAVLRVRCGTEVARRPFRGASAPASWNTQWERLSVLTRADMVRSCDPIVPSVKLGGRHDRLHLVGRSGEASHRSVRELVGDELVRSELDDRGWNAPPDEPREPRARRPSFRTPAEQAATGGCWRRIPRHLPPAWIRGQHGSATRSIRHYGEGRPARSCDRA